jgi:molybdate transport repressor ModE-like protein
MNRSLSTPVTIATRGGRQGAGMALTPCGLKLISGFLRFEDESMKRAAFHMRGYLMQEHGDEKFI